MVGIVVVICPDVISTTGPLGRHSVLVRRACHFGVRIRYVQRIRRIRLIDEVDSVARSVLTAIGTSGMSVVVIILF